MALGVSKLTNLEEYNFHLDAIVHCLIALKLKHKCYSVTDSGGLLLK